MKFTVTLKDADAVSDAVTAAVISDVEALGLDSDEMEVIVGMRVEKVSKIVAKWFSQSGQVSVQINTDTGAATVLPADDSSED